MHLVGMMPFNEWKQFSGGVRSDLAAKGVTEANVDTTEPLEGVVFSEWTLCVCYNNCLLLVCFAINTNYVHLCMYRGVFSMYKYGYEGEPTFCYRYKVFFGMFGLVAI